MPSEKTTINKIRKEFFDSKEFDSTKEDEDNIDFQVRKDNTLFQSINFLWAEAKRGKADIIESLVQLILTIGRAKTFENELPPLFLDAFDSQKIAFVPYHEIMHIFAQNDFKWGQRKPLKVILSANL